MDWGKAEKALWMRLENDLGKVRCHIHSWPFRVPVDELEHRAPDYYKIITNPIDLQTMKSKLEKKEYNSPRELYDDMRLMFDNCVLYNTIEDNVVRQCGTKVSRYWDKLWEQGKYEEQYYQILQIKGKQLSESLARNQHNPRHRREDETLLPGRAEFSDDCSSFGTKLNTESCKEKLKDTDHIANSCDSQCDQNKKESQPEFAVKGANTTDTARQTNPEEKVIEAMAIKMLPLDQIAERNEDERKVYSLLHASDWITHYKMNLPQGHQVVIMGGISYDCIICKWAVGCPDGQSVDDLSYIYESITGNPQADIIQLFKEAEFGGVDGETGTMIQEPFLSFAQRQGEAWGGSQLVGTPLWLYDWGELQEPPHQMWGTWRRGRVVGYEEDTGMHTVQLDMPGEPQDNTLHLFLGFVHLGPTAPGHGEAPLSRPPSSLGLTVHTPARDAGAPSSWSTAALDAATHLVKCEVGANAEALAAPGPCLPASEHADPVRPCSTLVWTGSNDALSEQMPQRHLVEVSDEVAPQVHDLLREVPVQSHPKVLTSAEYSDRHDPARSDLEGHSAEAHAYAKYQQVEEETAYLASAIKVETCEDELVEGATPTEAHRVADATEGLNTAAEMEVDGNTCTGDPTREAGVEPLSADFGGSKGTGACQELVYMTEPSSLVEAIQQQPEQLMRAVADTGEVERESTGAEPSTGEGSDKAEEMEMDSFGQMETEAKGTDEQLVRQQAIENEDTTGLTSIDGDGDEDLGSCGAVPCHKERDELGVNDAMDTRQFTSSPHFDSLQDVRSLSAVGRIPSSRNRLSVEVAGEAVSASPKPAANNLELGPSAVLSSIQQHLDASATARGPLQLPDTPASSQLPAAVTGALDNQAVTSSHIQSPAVQRTTAEVQELEAETRQGQGNANGQSAELSSSGRCIQYVLGFVIPSERSRIDAVQSIDDLKKLHAEFIAPNPQVLKTFNAELRAYQEYVDTCLRTHQVEPSQAGELIVQFMQRVVKHYGIIPESIMARIAAYSPELASRCRTAAEAVLAKCRANLRAGSASATVGKPESTGRGRSEDPEYEPIRAKYDGNARAGITGTEKPASTGTEQREDPQTASDMSTMTFSDIGLREVERALTRGVRYKYAMVNSTKEKNGSSQLPPGSITFTLPLPTSQNLQQNSARHAVNSTTRELHGSAVSQLQSSTPHIPPPTTAHVSGPISTPSASAAGHTTTPPGVQLLAQPNTLREKLNANAHRPSSANAAPSSYATLKLGAWNKVSPPHTSQTSLGGRSSSATLTEKPPPPTSQTSRGGLSSLVSLTEWPPPPTSQTPPGGLACSSAASLTQKLLSQDSIAAVTAAAAAAASQVLLPYSNAIHGAAQQTSSTQIPDLRSEYDRPTKQPRLTSTSSDLPVLEPISLATHSRSTTQVPHSVSSQAAQGTQNPQHASLAKQLPPYLPQTQQQYYQQHHSEQQQQHEQQRLHTNATPPVDSSEQTQQQQQQQQQLPITKQTEELFASLNLTSFPKSLQLQYQSAIDKAQADPKWSRFSLMQQHQYQQSVLQYLMSQQQQMQQWVQQPQQQQQHVTNRMSSSPRGPQSPTQPHTSSSPMATSAMMTNQDQSRSFMNQPTNSMYHRSAINNHQVAAEGSASVARTASIAMPMHPNDSTPVLESPTIPMTASAMHHSPAITNDRAAGQGIPGVAYVSSSAIPKFSDSGRNTESPSIPNPGHETSSMESSRLPPRVSGNTLPETRDLPPSHQIPAVAATSDPTADVVTQILDQKVPVSAVSIPSPAPLQAGEVKASRASAEPSNSEGCSLMSNKAQPLPSIAPPDTTNPMDISRYVMRIAGMLGKEYVTKAAMASRDTSKLEVTFGSLQGLYEAVGASQDDFLEMAKISMSQTL